MKEAHEPRARFEVELPAELVRALAADPAARAAWEKLPPSHRREYGGWVAEAKKELTRRRRAAKAVEMLRAGKAPG